MGSRGARQRAVAAVALGVGLALGAVCAAQAADPVRSEQADGTTPLIWAAYHLTPLDYAMGRSRVGFLHTKPSVRVDTAKLLHELGATAENLSLAPRPGIPTPTLSANVPE